MKISVLLLVLLSHSAFTEKHSLKFFIAGFSGIKDFLDYSIATELDGLEVFNHNSNKTLNINSDMVEALRKINPGLFDWMEGYLDLLPFIFKTMDNDAMQNFPQTEEQYSRKGFPDEFSGIPNFSDSSETLKMGGFEAIVHYINKLMKKYQDRLMSLVKSTPDLAGLIKSLYSKILPELSKDMVNIMMQFFNQTEGVHVFQMIGECQQDDKTGKVDISFKYGFDGEDDMSIDFKTLTVTVHKPEPFTEKVPLDPHSRFLKDFLGGVCSHTLQQYKDSTKHTQSRTVLPSVSLLQKSPSSPITCHATGFFPNISRIFWRKDGEELHEDMEHGEILPNNDGSFQMSVELVKLPSEDWGKYECVFQLSGVKEEIITKLDKDMIRTNYKVPHDAPHDAPHDKNPITLIIIISVTTAVCCLIEGVYKYRRAKRPKSTPENSSELDKLREDD